MIMLGAIMASIAITGQWIVLNKQHKEILKLSEQHVNKFVDDLFDLKPSDNVVPFRDKL